MSSAALKHDDYQRPFGLQHTTNSSWRNTKIEQDPENSPAFQVCQLLYGRAGGFAKVGQYSKHNFYATEVLTDPYKMASVIGSRRYKQSNTVLSVATYRSPQDGTQKNLLTINALCIDVDYGSSKCANIRDLEAKEAVYKFYSEILLDEVIPMPTYIEYGRNFRLVYVLEKPYIIPKTEKKRKSVLTFLRRVIQVISESIQSADDWSVDNKYKVTPYVRVPESHNVKWDNYRDNPFPSSCHEVCVWFPQDNLLWNIERLADTVLRDLPDWYDKYKSKQKVRKHAQTNIIRFNQFQSLFQKRMEDLQNFQQIIGDDDIGHRETAIYLYRLTALQSGMSEQEALDSAIAFNQRFAHPLSEHEVRSKCKPSNKEYKYKNTTIRSMLCIDEKIYPFLFAGDGKTRHDRYEESKTKKLENGYKSKANKLEELFAQILELHTNGMKQKEIADYLDIPIRTMKRHYSSMRKVGMLPQK